MNFLRNSYFKKSGALILLLLFISIHLVKAFHTHDLSYSNPTINTDKNGAVVKTNFTCAICDFQIAKDSDTEVATINIDAPFSLVVDFYNYTLAQLYNFSVTSSVRGPPSLLA